MSSYTYQQFQLGGMQTSDWGRCPHALPSPWNRPWAYPRMRITEAKISHATHSAQL